MKNDVKAKIEEIILNVLFQVVVLLLLVLIVQYSCLHGWYLGLYQKSKSFLVDIGLSQISNSLIVVSLTSLLSSKSSIVYWSDKIEFKLKKSGIGSFSSHVSRIFSGLVIGIYLILERKELFLINYAVSLVVMVWFMVDLIRVNFDDKSTENKMKKYYDKEKKKNSEEYKSIKKQIIGVTLACVKENNLEGFSKNIEFLESMDEWDNICRIFTRIDDKDMDFLAFFLEDNQFYIKSNERTELKEFYASKRKQYEYSPNQMIFLKKLYAQITQKED